MILKIPKDLQRTGLGWWTATAKNQLLFLGVPHTPRLFEKLGSGQFVSKI